MLSFLLESAIRSLGLGIAVWIGLRVFRIRSPHVQSLAWTAVLYSALTMPLLMPLLEAVIRRAPTAAMEWMPLAPLASLQPLTSNAPAIPASMDWIRILSIAYVAVAALFLFRILVGLLQSYRLRSSAVRLSEPWTGGTDVRISDGISIPATIGTTILFPANWIEWNAFERTCVFLHESSHIRRRDFYIQVLAGLHRAIFWFNPLAWWLERHLIEFAEAICDDAAIRQVEDRVSYAEMLVQLAGRASRASFYGLAMARGKTVAHRVERVLRETVIRPDVSLIRRVLTVLTLSPVVAFAAGSWLVEAGPTPPAPVPQTQTREARQSLLASYWAEDVRDIISEEERAAFEKLGSDEERQQFIAAFWKRRDPTPDTAINEFQEEFFRRIVLANQKYTTPSGTPGSQTDRGRILIRHGQPDEIETHAAGATATGAAGATATFPTELWLYKFIEGIGRNVILEFVDSGRDGTYRLRSDPANPNVIHVPGRQ